MAAWGGADALGGQQQGMQQQADSEQGAPQQGEDEEKANALGAQRQALQENAAQNAAAAAARKDGGDEGGGGSPAGMPQSPQSPQSNDNNKNQPTPAPSQAPPTQASQSTPVPQPTDNAQVVDLQKQIDAMKAQPSPTPDPALANSKQSTDDAIQKILDKSNQAAALIRQQADAIANNGMSGNGAPAPDSGPQTVGQKIQQTVVTAGATSAPSGDSPLKDTAPTGGYHPPQFFQNAGATMSGGAGAPAPGGAFTSSGGDSGDVSITGFPGTMRQRGRGAAVGYGGSGGGGTSSAGGGGGGGKDDGFESLFSSLLNPASNAPRSESAGGAGTLDISRSPASAHPSFPNKDSATAGAAAAKRAATFYLIRNYKMKIDPPKPLKALLGRIQLRVLGSTPERHLRITANSRR